MAEKKPVQQAVPTEAETDAHVDDLVNKALKALEEFEDFTQEQVDYIVAKCSVAGLDHHGILAEAAVKETGRGVFEDKAVKNLFACEYVTNNLRHLKTVGIINEDPLTGITEIAEPVGVVCGIVPTTNPTSTVIFKSLIALKTRNPIIFSFHPSAHESSKQAAIVIRDAAIAAGAPENCIQWLSIKSMYATNALMNHPGIATILATGGNAMVAAAYSCGKPALGVGAGNVPAYVEKTCVLPRAVNDIVLSKSFDNGMICASEQSGIVDKKVYKAVKDEFIARGCHFLTKTELDKVRKTILINGSLNAKIVGQSAYTIAKLAGVDVSRETKILIGEVASVDLSEEFAHEKLSPVLAMYKSDDFNDAIDKASHLIADGGYGHTSSIYINSETEKGKLDIFEETMKTCRILINTPSSQGGIGDLYNFKLTPSLTLGCGSWGGNSVSENVGVKHLLNIKTVAERRENMLWFRAPEKVYFKKGCLPVALNELKTVLGKKKAFIVTDQFLYKNGYTKCITDKLDELGIVYTVFYDVAPDPTLACAKEGAKAMNQTA